MRVFLENQIINHNNCDMSIDEQKKAIRKQIKVLKKNVSLEDKKSRSFNILDTLEKDEAFIAADTVMLYWSMEDEVFTHDFVVKWAKRKKLILPCVNGASLDLRIFKGLENLVEGEGFGILEPSGELFTDIDSLDLIIVPGVAFDKNNNRMGRGKAYYDKLLTTTSCQKVGICFNFQLLDVVPINKYDVKMNSIISE